MPVREIPDIVVGRLPVYLRALTHLSAESVPVTSSHELGKRLGISAAQIRKDLSHFGEFGKQGTGYNVAFLRDQLKRILQVDREWPVALIGLGDLGRAIAHYGGFVDRGFRIVALFDGDPAKIGRKVGELEIMGMDRLTDILREHNIQIAMVAVPAAHAQKVAELCVAAGVRSILNYAPISLSLPEGTRVQYLDPVVGLQRMTHYL
jgi:redox-sensing transcriptional repressor